MYLNGFLPVFTTAEEDGWHLEQGDSAIFMDDEKFAEFVKDHQKLTAQDIGFKEVKLPEGTKIEDVRKGDSIVTQPWSDTTMGVQSDAHRDGYIITLDEKRRFFSDLEFRSIFNQQAAAKDKSQAYYRAALDADAAVTRFVVLDAPVTFDFQEGEYEAEAGMVLYENADDVDGYTVVPFNSFVKQFEITQAPAAKAAPSAKPALKR
jgi:hypothetical protein